MQASRSTISKRSAWTVAVVVLVAAVGWQGGWITQPAPAAETAAPAAVPAQPVALNLLPDYQIDGGVAARRDTVERPAFVPTRRPAPAPVQEAPRPKMPRGQFTLTGTALVDQKHIAFLRENAGGKSRTVRAGETINGVVIAEVKPDRVKLTMGDESEELTLKVATNPRMTVQPPVPGAGPGPVPQPPRPQIPGQPVAADTGAPMDSDASILERRRAARAAMAAQQEAAAAAAGQAPAQPAAQAGPVAIPQPSTPQPAAAGPADPGWSDVYRRMQQPRR